MFESDDFDQILSQFDFPEVASIKPNSTDEDVRSHCPSEATLSTLRPLENISINTSNFHTPTPKSATNDDIQLMSTKVLSSTSVNKEDCFVSPKHLKRKIINTHIEHKSKRKFPGPAGLLTGTLEESNDDTISHMELSSQDIEYNTNQHGELFQSPLWTRLLDDVKHWDIDPIAMIKEQALEGDFRKRKAPTVAAFVEAVDRSVPDPVVTLRDSSGNIKCTLHRNAWDIFSLYMVSEYCALVLLKPTVQKIRSTLKKQSLNITLSNIYAVYSSAVIKDEDVHLPDGYTMICEDNFTVIKKENVQNDSNPIANNKAADDSIDLQDELESIFSDDLF